MPSHEAIPQRLKIAIVGHIRHAIAEPFMGGMEAHCHQLVRGLEARGHEVALFAAGGSAARDLRPICDQPYEAVLPWDRWRGTERLDAYQDRAFARARAMIAAGGFDVVHNNALFPGLTDWGRDSAVPMVTSQHVPPFATMRAAVGRAKDASGSHFTVTSRQQRAAWGADAGANMHVVPNGVAVDEWCPAPERGDYLLWYGRITPNKGLRETVSAARRAGIRLKIVGSLEDRAYFDTCAAPFLGAAISYDGHLSGSALRRVVAGARAVVVTPMWDEPFGLVAAEAMAAAVPVIAFDRGAMPEVLGECGALVPAGDIATLARAMRAADTLDGAACRQRVVARFSVERMLDRYEDIYRLAMADAERAAGARAA